MKKVLPIHEKHNIVTPLMYGNILSILLTDNRILPWINSNYVLIEGIVWEGDQDCLYRDGYSVCMEHNRLPEFLEVKNHILHDADCIKTIQELIDRNEYVYLQIDEFYLYQCTKGNEEHLLHDLLIYGYDSDKEKLFVLGVDKNLHYGKLEASYESIELALRNRIDATIWNENFVNGAYQKWVSENSCLSIQYNADKITFKYEASAFLALLEQYISDSRVKEVYFTEINSDAVYMGIHYYDLLIKNTYVTNGYKLFVLINHLFEHKAGMVEKLRYLCERTSELQLLSFIEQYRISVYAMARQLQLNMLRINIKMTRNELKEEQLKKAESKIIKMLREMKQEEYRILFKVITCLKRYPK